tara:strand:+ start:269 stop:502 length:234 start_codon:yes stop_codon:yes gene_type:complete
MFIITLTKDSEKTIFQTAESLKNQNIKNFNWIIVDDDSNDSRINIIKSYQTLKIKILNSPNLGIFNAYNFTLDYIKK